MRTKASAAEKSTPANRALSAVREICDDRLFYSPLAIVKSSTRNLMGSFVQLAASRIFLMVASQLEMVPKKRNPCSLITRICLPTSLRNAVCFGCLRTVDLATDPVRMERIARRWEDRTTKETQARINPAARPITKSHTVITTTIVQMVTYSNRETRPWVSHSACREAIGSSQLCSGWARLSHRGEESLPP